MFFQQNLFISKVFVLLLIQIKTLTQKKILTQNYLLV